MGYSYPINDDWTTDEIVTVVQFLAAVEQAYEGGVSYQIIRDAYQKYKQIVNSISEEKRIDREFTRLSGYAIYPVVKQLQAARSNPPKKIIIQK